MWPEWHVCVCFEWHIRGVSAVCLSKLVCGRACVRACVRAWFEWHVLLEWHICV